MTDSRARSRASVSPCTQPVLDAAEAGDLILVTGATGFLGGHLVRALLEKGRAVRASGLNVRKGLELAALGAEFLPVDLRDRASVAAACRGVRAVVHAGALSSARGRRRDFLDVNVAGTEHVIAGCRMHGVDRLVYVSTASVLSRYRVQLGLDESLPFPETFVSVCSESKALAELRVREAGRTGLKTVILRPRAIYGPGDQAIFPRIVQAVSRGRFPIPGDGSAVTDVTHVDDAVRAILLALESERAAGGTYHITGGEEVNLLEGVRRIIDRMGCPPLKRRVPAGRAMRAAGLVEKLWEALRLRGEPPLTRCEVGIMVYSQTHDISAARRDLGYEPRVTWQEGVGRLLDSIDAGVPAAAPAPAAGTGRGPGNPPVAVACVVLKAGATEARERFFGLGRGWKRVLVPALFAWVRHPARGHVLFDTGYSTRFHEATRGLPERLYAVATPVEIRPGENAGAQLERRGVNPEDVAWVLVSHFDPDHIGGLRDFPRARIVCLARAWEAVAGKRGLRALAARLLPGLLPEDLAARLLLLPDPAGPPIGPFEASLDLFGDGSVRLVRLPGHAPGMMGAFVETGEAGSLFLCADAVWTRRALEGGPGAGPGVHRLIAHDRAAQDACYRLLGRLHAEHPEVTLVPSHCPDAAAQLVDRAAGEGECRQAADG